MSENYEVLIGTGDNDSDSDVKISLINSSGSESNIIKPAQYGEPNRDNYEKGSIEVCQNIPFTLDGDPTKVKVYFSGDKWRLGGIWITHQSSGKTWYATPNIMITSSSVTVDLKSISTSSSGDAKYSKFKGKIHTGSDGTNDKVFLKLFDGNGKSTLTVRPGAPDGPMDTINDWQSNSNQDYSIDLVPVDMGNIEYILLAKYGSNSWSPLEVTAAGAPAPSETRTFNQLHDLTKDNNKWVFTSS